MMDSSGKPHDGQTPLTGSGAPPGHRAFAVFAMAFGVFLVLSNILAVKVIAIGGLTLPAGIVVFPLTYILGDVFTEVYGFRRTRRVIWGGFFLLMTATLLAWIATLLPPAPFWGDQEAFVRFFGFVPRIALASMIAYFVGEYVNSVIMSVMKVRMGGRRFGVRAVVSTLCGEGIDSILFNSIAFIGVFAIEDVVRIVISGWILKTVYELLALPVTYRVTAWLKRVEGVDVYDIDEDYRPIGLGARSGPKECKS